MKQMTDEEYNDALGAIIEEVESCMDRAADFRADLLAKYNSSALTVDEIIALQSQILRVSDYAEQKHEQAVALRRQLIA